MLNVNSVSLFNNQELEPVTSARFARLFGFVDNALSIIGAAVVFSIISNSDSNPDITWWVLSTLAVTVGYALYQFLQGVPKSVESANRQSGIRDVWSVVNGLIWSVPALYLSCFTELIYQITPVVATSVLVIVSSLTTLGFKRFLLVVVPPIAALIYSCIVIDNGLLWGASAVFLAVFMVALLVSLIVDRSAENFVTTRRQINAYVQKVETERDKLQEVTKALNHTDELFALVANNASDIILLHDSDGRYLFANEAIQRLLGYAPDEMLGKDPVTFIHEDDQQRVIDDIRSPSLAGEDVKPTRLRFKHKQGHYVWLETGTRPVAIDGQEVNVVSVSRDITAQVQLEKDLHKRATTDPVTSALNRSTFEEIIDSRSQSRSSDRGDTLIYVDIDHFKIVNDTSGPLAGDQMLAAICSELQSHISDKDFLARMGGDEFAVLLVDCDLSEATIICEKMRHALANGRFNYGDRYYSMASSFGLVYIDEQVSNSSTALQRADVACYVAKHSGRNAIHTWREGDRIAGDHMRAMNWVTTLQSALDNERVELFAQGIHPLKTDTQSAHHHEVLCTITDETGSSVSPTDFVAAAELFGLAAQLDFYVIDHAFAALAKSPLDNMDSWLSINLSADTLCNHESLPKIKKLFEQHGVNPQRICFEITETATLRSLETAKELLERLAAMGSKIALDDFGSGHSSFENLTKLPIDVVKIDGQFIQDLNTNAVSRTIVAGIYLTAQALGIETIAEWVEDEETAKTLAALGVEYGQGFHFDKRRPLTEVLS